MSTPYRCPECEEIYVITGHFSCCLNGHGRLRPAADGLTPSAAKRYAKRESALATLATMPIAVRVPEEVFEFAYEDEWQPLEEVLPDTPLGLSRTWGRSTGREQKLS